MAGLLGFMAAGAAKGYSQGRGQELQQQKEFDLKKALMDAQMDKELRLKEAGYEMDDKRAANQMERNKGYMQGDDGKELTMQEAATKAARTGDLETSKGLLALAPKTENSYESIKRDDGSIFAFDKSTGTGKVILEGGGMIDVPKNEIELAYKIAGGDPKKAADILVTQKSRIAAAGRAPRAPERMSDDDQSYSDWKKKAANQGKGRDDYSKEKASWGKADELGLQTVSAKPKLDDLGDPVLDSKGNPVIEKTFTSKEAKPKAAPKPWERKY